MARILLGLIALILTPLALPAILILAPFLALWFVVWVLITPEET